MAGARPKHATRADVARLAGVSESTVSYVLSGVRPISVKTRTRVETAMRTLDYMPNALAQGLASRRSGLLAVLFPIRERGLNRSDFHYMLGASQVARKAGYELLLWPMETGDIEPLDRVVRRLVEGILVMEVQIDDPRIQLLEQKHANFVTIGRSRDIARHSSVDADFDAWGSVAIEHFQRLGHKSIVFFTQSAEFMDRGYGPVVRIESSLVKAAETAGIEVTIQRVAPTVRAGREALDRTLEAHPSVTGLVGINEPAMTGAIEALQIRGLSIPGDMSIVQFGVSADVAESTIPFQTTISVDGHELGSIAMSYLLDLIDGRATEPRHFLGRTVFADRGSTGVPRAL